MVLKFLRGSVKSSFPTGNTCVLAWLNEPLSLHKLVLAPLWCVRVCG